MAVVDAEAVAGRLEVRMAEREEEEEVEGRMALAGAGDRGVVRMAVMAAIGIARGVAAGRAVDRRGAAAGRIRTAGARRGEEG